MKGLPVFGREDFRPNVDSPVAIQERAMLFVDEAPFTRDSMFAFIVDDPDGLAVFLLSLDALGTSLSNRISPNRPRINYRDVPLTRARRTRPQPSKTQAPPSFPYSSARLRESPVRPSRRVSVRSWFCVRREDVLVAFRCGREILEEDVSEGP